MQDFHHGHCKSHGTTWVLVADSQHAQVYDWRKIGGCGANGGGCCGGKAPRELVPLDDRAMDAEVVALEQGQGTQADLKNEMKNRFVRRIAQNLGAAHDEKDYDRLILVAPAKMIGCLREQLPSDVQRDIAAVLPKDLMHCDRYELLAHLQDTLAEAHVA